MSKAHDPYLQAAEGFLHAIRDELDMADDLQMDRTLQVTQTYALVSIARSLNVLSDRAEDADDSPLAMAGNLMGR
ncbi:hypothetical protein Daura_09115 [Dactylosporangium aurantiacum]|uniref:Uncharacterized protein n=1 Tax=Dactylosporangium aurantiacum TaxID=35754 RepID=A0A9Q9ILN4_9ACTN|nr:hypothetical protein [Dactylosporangium aurantiacum]MDG6109749.1 hypothetical protein [Dactylosporangium aurantiacum]UWZ56315.1 hypothetical protein Daura_09115 [Dactylosporangium aurantiacum]